MKKFIIICNWKMNFPDNIEAILNISNSFSNRNLEISLATPFTEFNYILPLIKNSYLTISAQNVSEYKEGSYTGEISANILSKYKIKYCIVGHSERREHFIESNEKIINKIENLINNNIIPIICIGEIKKLDITQRKEFLKNHLKILNSLNKEQNFVIAYEPLWAIGTGNSMNLDEVEELFNFLKEFLKNYSNFKLLYGGSVNSNNVKDFFDSKIIDGILLGKSSIVSTEFKNVLERCK